MQTFLPYADFGKTAACLDWRRLGKQRVEAMQIWRLHREPVTRINFWRAHPAVRMWKGYEDALALYYNAIREEWIRRGYVNRMPRLPALCPEMPPWMGDERFHRSHQSNLLRKFEEHYAPFFPGVPDDLPYFWPVLLRGVEEPQELF